MTVSELGRSIQIGLDSSSHRIVVKVVDSRWGRRNEELAGQRVLPKFDVRPRSAVPSSRFDVEVDGARIERAWFWCVEPNCAVPGLVLAFAGVQNDPDPARRFAPGVLPLVGDLGSGPEQIATQWAQLTQATVVSLLDSFAADH